MKIVYNKYIPFKGTIAFYCFGLLFVREEYKPLMWWQINHEKIHTKQARELLYIFFYLWYCLEWIYKLIQYRNFKKAYFNISFEREAYVNHFNVNYINDRKRFAFVNYLRERYI